MDKIESADVGADLCVCPARNGGRQAEPDKFLIASP